MADDGKGIRNQVKIIVVVLETKVSRVNKFCH